MVLSLHVHEAACHGNISLAGGLGFPELINAGILYQIRQTQVGISLGGWPFSDELLGSFFVYSISGDVYYHFDKPSELYARREWFFRSGLTYFDAGGTDQHLLLNGRLGKDFNTSEKTGIRISAGIILGLDNNYNNNDPQEKDKKRTFIFPCIGRGFYYRFGNKQTIHK
jgi:hypothetical protein